MENVTTKPPSLKEVLTLAREKIAKGWTQRAYARDSSGLDVLEYDPQAVCWCAEGALYAATSNIKEGGPQLRNGAREKIRVVINGNNVVNWNDAHGRTQQQVLEAFDKAIALA